MGELGFAPPALEFDAPLAACPVCAAAEIGHRLTDGRGVRIDGCERCGTWFMNPRYTDAALAEFYAGYTEEEALGAHDPTRRARKLRNLRRVLPHQRGGRLLGVGCGDGLELVLARELGFEIEGVEVDAAHAARLAAHLGCEVRAGHLPEIEPRPGRYDVVFLDQVLEHVKRPDAYLERVRELLAPGGLLYLGVPNVQSLSARWKLLQDRLGLRNAARRGSYLDAWQHLTYFGPGQLARLLERRFGFEVLEVLGDPDAGGGPLEALRVRVPLVESSLIVLARRPRTATPGRA
ncbi:MAG: class I SAM-dependent methyltransferase [Planctomycetes bacterium]|nr:class I SAM-dependent methyltransferase [Planctomycetota bacterium]